MSLFFIQKYQHQHPLENGNSLDMNVLSPAWRARLFSNLFHFSFSFLKSTKPNRIAYLKRIGQVLYIDYPSLLCSILPNICS